MSSNSVDHTLPSAAHFRQHAESIAERLRRARPAGFPPADMFSGHRAAPFVPSPKSFTPQPAVAIVTCPLDLYWPDWATFNVEKLFAGLSGQDLAVCARARRARPRLHRCRVPLVWELGRHEPPLPRPLPPSQTARTPTCERHIHTETLINRRLVHIDFVSLMRHTPEQSSDACHVFVDGQLAGRGGRCGTSIGGGGYCLPAVALVDVGLAVTVDDIADEHGPVVELWDVDEDGTSSAEGAAHTVCHRFSQPTRGFPAGCSR